MKTKLLWGVAALMLLTTPVFADQFVDEILFGADRCSEVSLPAANISLSRFITNLSTCVRSLKDGIYYTRLKMSDNAQKDKEIDGLKSKVEILELQIETLKQEITNMKEATKDKSK